MGESRYPYRYLLGRPEGVRSFRSGLRWENNIKVDLQEKGFGAWN
jgi:hypothetical protein